MWLWLALMSWSLPAAAQSLGEGIRAYDFESLAWGVLVATVGGTGRTVLTLLNSEMVVLSVLREAWKDIVIAALAGAVTYLIVAAYNSLESTPALPVPVTVLLLAAAGWARMGFFVWSERAGARIADSAVDFVTKKMTPKTDPSSRTTGRFTRPEDDNER